MKFFKGKQKQPVTEAPAAPAPRSMEELNKVYQELCARTGQLQYKMAVDKEQLKQLNEAIRSVNLEADARQKLDAERTVTEAPEKAPEVSNG